LLTCCQFFVDFLSTLNCIGWNIKCARLERINSTATKATPEQKKDYTIKASLYNRTG
jgi:hypothetical protein